MEWILKGVAVGFAFALFIGPMFFIYLQSCVKRGFKYGLYVALGAWSSDILLISVINLIVLILLSTAQLEQYSFILYGIGGVLLIIVGLQMYLVRKEAHEEYDHMEFKETSTKLPFLLYGKGVLINVLNPAVLFYWFGLSVNLTINEETGEYETLLFFSGAVLVRVVMDLLKLYLSKKIREFLNVKKVMFIQRLTGILLVVIGIGLITTGWSSGQEILFTD